MHIKNRLIKKKTANEIFLSLPQEGDRSSSAIIANNQLKLKLQIKASDFKLIYHVIKTIFYWKQRGDKASLSHRMVFSVKWMDNMQIFMRAEQWMSYIFNQLLGLLWIISRGAVFLNPVKEWIKQTLSQLFKVERFPC